MTFRPGVAKGRPMAFWEMFSSNAMDGGTRWWGGIIGLSIRAHPNVKLALSVFAGKRFEMHSGYWNGFSEDT